MDSRFKNNSTSRIIPRVMMPGLGIKQTFNPMQNNKPLPLPERRKAPILRQLVTGERQLFEIFAQETSSPPTNSTSSITPRLYVDGAQQHFISWTEPTKRAKESRGDKREYDDEGITETITNVGLRIIG